jgi:hypothetical protein
MKADPLGSAKSYGEMASPSSKNADSCEHSLPEAAR